VRFTIWTIIFVLVIATRAPAQTTRPVDRTDQSTQDILKELDAAGATTQPTAAPSGQNASSSTKFEDTAQSYDWGRLFNDFRLMLLTAGALGIASAVIGLFVLLRREALVALAIPQVVAVGVAIGMRFFGENHTLPPAMAVALVALVYFAMSRRWGASNWIIPSFYVAGMCLSFLIIANHGQDIEDLQHRFAGVDVAVSAEQARLAVPVLLAVAAACALLWRRWLLLAQAPAAAELAGLRPARWDTLFLVLLTITTLLGTDSLGVVMVLSMLFLPAATVLPWVRRIPVAMAAGAVLSLVYLAVGFYLSIRMNWPLSQSVGGAGFAVLAVSQLTAQLKG